MLNFSSSVAQCKSIAGNAAECCRHATWTLPFGNIGPPPQSVDLAENLRQSPGATGSATNT
jgi:hypothetical protein